MQTYSVLAAGIAALVVVGTGMVVLALVRNVRTAQGPTLHGRYPQGHWMSGGVLIGLAVGCAFAGGHAL